MKARRRRDAAIEEETRELRETSLKTAATLTELDAAVRRRAEVIEAVWEHKLGDGPR